MVGIRAGSYGREHMKTTSLPVVGMILLQLLVTPALHAEESRPTVGAGVKVGIPQDDTPSAVLVSLQGKDDYSLDGVNFTPLTAKDVFTVSGSGRRGGAPSGATQAPLVLHQGAVLRTGANSRVDVFFRRVGTVVRLQPDTEVKLEKMTRSMQNGAPVLETLLEVRQGRIFTAVRSVVAGSTFAIRNAAGQSVVEGAPPGTIGRYIITADGTQVGEKSSRPSEKVTGGKGITVIMPGQKLDAKEGKPLPAAPPEAVAMLIEFDELHAFLETAHPATAPKP